MKFQSLAVILLILSITAIDAGRYSGERNGYRRNRGRNSRRGGFNRGRFGLGFPGFGFGVGGFGLGLGYGALGLGVGGVGLGGIGLGGVGLGGVGLGGVGLGGVGLGGVGLGGVGLGGVGVGGVGLGGVGVAGVQGVTGAVNTNGVINNNGLVNTAGVINNNRLVNSAGVVNNNRYANTAGAVNTFGKRSMANETMTILPVMEETESFCFLNSSALMTSTINCNGPVHNFECQVERELNLEHVEQELESLRIMPASFSKNSSVHEHVVLSFSKEDSMFNNFTLNHDDTSFVFAFFHNETVSEEGFRIKDLECWEEFEEMMTHDEQVNLKISLTL